MQVSEAARYVIAMDEGTNFHSTEVMLVHDGSTVTMTQYGTLKDTNLATFDADISGDNVRLLITPASAKIAQSSNLIEQW